eukprot:g4909.t1
MISLPSPPRLQRTDTSPNLPPCISNDISSQLILALAYKKTGIGLASYSFQSRELQTAYCNIHQGDVAATLVHAIQHFSPKLLITNQRLPVAIVDILLKLGGGGGGGGNRSMNSNEQETNNETPFQFDIRVLKNNDFKDGHELISRTMVGASHSHTPSSHFFLDNKEITSACAGLLFYLATNHAVDQIDSSAAPVNVEKIVHVSLEDYMYMDQVTFQSLNIFVCDNHPSVVKGRGRRKEGFSIFSLLDKCNTAVGSTLLKSWMKKPLRNKKILEQRYDAIEYLMTPLAREVAGCLTTRLRKTKNLRRILLRIKQAVSTPADYHNLTRSLQHALEIREICKRMQIEIKGNVAEPEVFQSLRRIANQDIEYIARELIPKYIDLSRSLEEKKIVILPGINQELDELRKNLAILDEMLEHFQQQDNSPNGRYHKYLSGLSWCYEFKSGFGYVLAIENPSHEISLPREFKWVFNIDSRSFFQCSRTHDFDAQIGDLAERTADKERDLFIIVEDRLLEYEISISDLSDALAELDVLLSFTTCIIGCGFTRPTLLTPEDGPPVLLIQKGWHPLQSEVVLNFIPNDTVVKCPDKILNVITGPNFSGKSVYLKQVGLICYLAQIGMFVPAETAKISIVDRIFTRIQSLESCISGQSTFQLDCLQVAKVLTGSTPQSLVLIDEFGKGTNIADGLSLFAAALEELSNRGSNCPRTLVTTHFQQTEWDGQLPKNGVLYLYMKSIMHSANNTEIDNEDEESQNVDRNGDIVVPLFQLCIGCNKDAYAIHCARHAGLSTKITNRASELQTKFIRSEPITPITAGGCRNKKADSIGDKIIGALASRVDWMRATLEDVEEIAKLTEAL